MRVLPIAVVDFPQYEIDNFGNVYNRKTKQKLKQHTSKDGYKKITLWNGTIKKTFLVHRLVAITYLENPSNLPEINHKDENKQNNSVDNLEWCDRCYNTHYGKNAPAEQWKKRDLSKFWGANKKVVIQLSLGEKLIAKYPSSKEASDKTGISRCNITKCCSDHKRKTAGGYKWRYEI